MKSSKMLSLFAATMMTVAVNAGATDEVLMMTVADEIPMATDDVRDLKQYLFGGVDSNGQTILHIVANECDNDNFIMGVKLFDLLENNVEGAEVLADKIEKFGSLFQLSPELSKLVMVRDINRFIRIKDNNGNMAVDIAKKKNELNPHDRCGACMVLLSLGDIYTKPAQPVIDLIVDTVNK